MDRPEFLSAAARGAAPPSAPRRAPRPKRLLALFFKKETLAFLLIVVVSAALRLPTFYRTVLDWDESLYMLMADQWLAGHLPYTTIWDNKPVGIYAIFAAFKLIFRGPVVAMRAAAVLAASLTAFGLWRLAPIALADRPFPLRRRLAALAAAAFILGSLSNDGLSANTEMFMECCSLFAFLAACAPGFCAAAPARRGFAAGLLFGMACMTKYVAVFEAPALAYALLVYQTARWPWRRRAGIALGAAAGAMLLPALTILAYAASGHLGLWWRCSILDNIVRVSAPVAPAQLRQAALVILPRWLPFMLAAFSLFATAPAAAPAAPRNAAPAPARASHRFRPLLMLWLTGGALGVASAKSFYDHYFLQILPPLCLAFVYVLPGLIRGLAAWSRGAFIALAAALLAVPAYAGAVTLAAISQPFAAAIFPTVFHNPDTPSRIAAALRPAIARGATLYVFDSQPILYALTGATPPTRYVFPSVLTRCPLEKVAGIDAAREVAAILSQNPDFIIRSPSPPGPGANASVYREVAFTLAGNYTVFKTFPDAVVYRRKPGAPAAVSPMEDSCAQAK